MRLVVVVTALVSLACACGKAAEKGPGDGSKEAPKTVNQLSPSDLSTPDYVDFQKNQLVSELLNSEELFEYKKPESSTATTPRFADEATCFKEWLGDQLVEAGKGFYSSEVVTDQRVLDCFLSGLDKSFQEAAKNSDGMIIYEPADSSASSEEKCVTAENDYSSGVGRAGSWTRHDVRSAEDFTAFDGKSLLDLYSDLDKNALRLAASKAGVAKTLVQRRGLVDNAICHERKFSRYTVLKASSNECQQEHLDASTVKQSCEFKHAERIISIDAGPIDMTTLRNEQTHDNHFVESISEDVVRKEGAIFPHAGMKTVRIRNWTGTITFGEGNPTYFFTNGTETVDGTYLPKD